MRVRILVNAIRLSNAGGLRVGLNMMRELDRLCHADEVLFLGTGARYSEETLRFLQLRNLPAEYSGTRGWLGGQRWLKQQIREFRPDVILNLCNTPIRTSIPQVLLLQWAYAVYDEPEIWENMSLSDYWKRKLRVWLIRRNLPWVDVVTVQSQTMKTRFLKKYPQVKWVEVIPGSVDLSPADVQPIPDGNIKSFFFLSKYYSHKNHHILLEAAKIIAAEKLNFRFLITVSENAPDSAAFLKSVHQAGLSQILVNLGEVSHQEIFAIYGKSYASVNPSLLESFGLTYLEAVAAGRPVIAADTDFSREILHDAAFYFDPHNPQSLIEALQQSLNPDAYATAVMRGNIILRNWPNWAQVAERYYEILQSIYSNETDRSGS